MLVCVFLSVFARETAGAARTRSSLRPLTEEGRVFQQDSREMRGEIAKLCFLHLARLRGEVEAEGFG
jgi:hypothetical protein